MSTGFKVAQAGVQAATLLAGGRSTMSTSEYTLDADEEQFKSAAMDALHQANKRFVDAIIAGR